MSSIMRARSADTGRGEEGEIIGGASLELKVAGPSMLGIGCPDRHALLLTHPPPLPKTHRPRRAESCESGFVLGSSPAACPRRDERPESCAQPGVLGSRGELSEEDRLNRPLHSRPW